MRILARAATDVSAEAASRLKGVTEPHNASQPDRFRNFLDDLYGGPNALDNTRLADDLHAAARGVQFWDDRLHTLTSAPEVQKAIRDVERRSATEAVLDGYRPIRNPFQFDTDGATSWRTSEDGGAIIPNLEFLDIVKPNFDNQARGLTHGSNERHGVEGLARAARSSRRPRAGVRHGAVQRGEVLRRRRSAPGGPELHLRRAPRDDRADPEGARRRRGPWLRRPDVDDHRQHCGGADPRRTAARAREGGCEVAEILAPADPSRIGGILRTSDQPGRILAGLRAIEKAVAQGSSSKSAAGVSGGLTFPMLGDDYAALGEAAGGPIRFVDELEDMIRRRLK